MTDQASESTRYLKYSTYLQKKYGEKVYKLLINLPVTCPNRDGLVGSGGCTFCGDEGAGFENLAAGIPVEQQLSINRDRVAKRFNAQKYIAYFQNYTNTYLDYSSFVEAMTAACQPQVVELAISTRPDCLNSRYMDFLARLAETKGVNITIELGLQTVNYHTLKKINRGHTLAEFIDAVLECQKRGFATCAHLILNLPGELMEDGIENAKIMSALGVDQVKLHSLYIVKNTVMAEQYLANQLELISREEYIQRVIAFLEYLNPEIAVQRLVGRAPEENTLFCNWNTSGWKITAMIEEEMEVRNTWQGKKYTYLKGAALK